MRCYFEKSSLRTSRSVITRLKEHRQTQLLLSLRYAATHFPLRLQGSNLSIGPQPESFYLHQSTTLKNRWFCVSRQNPHSLKVPKIAINNDVSDYSNWVFSTSSRLSSSIKVPSESFTPVEEESIDKELILINASKSW